MPHGCSSLVSRTRQLALKPGSFRGVRRTLTAMARPSLPLGTAGAVTTSRDGSGWHARCRYRDHDGEVRQIQRHGRTEARAKHALAEAVRDRSRPTVGGELHADSRVAALAEAWYLSLHNGKRSPTTLAQYRYRLDRQVVPVIGKLRIRELSAGRIDAYLRDTTTTYGASTAKMVRSVLSGMCGLAVRQDLLDRNPVRDASHISVPVKRAPRSLTLAQARQLRAFVTYDDRAITRDLPDLIGFMLATGSRLGEAAALQWTDVDLDTGLVEITGTVVRVTGKGLVISRTKTMTSQRVLEIPSWTVALLTARYKNRSITTEKLTPVFPAPLGGLRDPSNTAKDLRDAFADAGFDWVTSHTLRKTVASALDSSGLSAREIADQLGHARPSLTLDIYMGRKVASSRGAAALEAFA
jgi:integrase